MESPTLAGLIRRTPVLGTALARVYVALLGNRKRASRFPGSAGYWERRYSSGGDSGAGSYGKHARFKAQVLNTFVADHDVSSAIEFGCGDGNQLALARYPRYSGYDVSEQAIARCRQRFTGDAAKIFELLGGYAGERADLALSLDVIYHLVEDAVFLAHMEVLFGAADRYVIIYSSNTEDRQVANLAHVRNRTFTDWVDVHAPAWTLIDHIASPRRKWPRSRSATLADFFVFGKTNEQPPAAGVDD
jgi:SAM-dependent methyltransferase